MVYALERELYLGSTFAVLIELPEGRDVSSGPVSRVRHLASNSLPLDQPLQRDGPRRTRGSQPPPAHLFARDARADGERYPRASCQASVLGRTQTEGKAGNATARTGVACS